MNVGRFLAALVAPAFIVVGCRLVLGTDEFMRADARVLPDGAASSSAGGGGTGGVGAGDACSDGELSPGEADVDCGVACAGKKCADGKHCRVPDDCDHGVCGTDAPGEQVCLPASCTDTQKNGDETDVDCGGRCPPCAQGKRCDAGADCATGSCSPAYADTDGGGVCCGVACALRCERCVPGSGACVLIEGYAPGDCPGLGNKCCALDASSCEAGTCSQCNDAQENGEETDVDCGGGVCDACIIGKGCSEGRDCSSCICLAGSCAAPTCGNGVKDGCESDVDCGGPCKATCGHGQACSSKSDCASQTCVNGGCVGP